MLKMKNKKISFSFSLLIIFLSLFGWLVVFWNNQIALRLGFSYISLVIIFLIVLEDRVRNRKNEKK